MGRAQTGRQPQGILQAKHRIGRSIQPGEREAEQEVDFRPMRQSCRGFHSRLECICKATQPGEQFSEEPVGLALPGVDRDGLTQGGFRPIPLAQVKQGAGEMEVQTGVLRPCLEGCDKVCPGTIGPTFVNEQQPAHQIVVREKTGPETGTRSQPSVGESGVSLQQGQGFSRAAKPAKAVDAVEHWPQSIRSLSTNSLEERKCFRHPAGIHVGDRQVECPLAGFVVREGLQRRGRVGERAVFDRRGDRVGGMNGL